MSRKNERDIARVFFVFVFVVVNAVFSVWCCVGQRLKGESC